MTQQRRTAVGFLSPISAESPHFASVRGVLPPDVELGIEGLGLVRDTLDDLKTASEPAFERAKAALAAHPEWQAAAMLGAPTELYNPGLVDRVKETASIPITSAMRASVAASKALGLRKVLLMTPFDPELNAILRDHLAKLGLETVSPSRTLGFYRDAMGMGPEDVYKYLQESVAEARGVQGIYFQGAILDPIPRIDQMEAEFRMTVIASNLAMLWHTVSLAGGRSPIDNAGRLMREWPGLPG